MHRDMDIIRKIILALRDAPLGEAVGMVEGVENENFAAHVQLLVEAGLVMAALQGADRNNPNAPMKRTPQAAIAYRLTWAGQDFADAILDDTVWRKARDKVIKPAGSWTFGVLLDVLKSEIVSRVSGA